MVGLIFFVKDNIHTFVFDDKPTNNFFCIHTLNKQGNPIAIYPEAHIWPYCPFIRPFKKGTFRYPVELDAPVYAGVTTYQKRKFFSTPKVTIYVLGPYYVDTTISPVLAEEKIRNTIEKDMQTIMDEYNTYRPIEYIKKENH